MTASPPEQGGVGLPALGVGLVLWPELMPLLSHDDGAVNLVEIEPEFFWFETGVAREPLRVDEEVVRQLQALPLPKLVHGVAFPVAGTLPPDPHHLALLRKVVTTFDSPWVSEHLSFNATAAHGDDRQRGSTNAGFLLPQIQTAEAACQAAANIRTMAAYLQVPFAVETNVNYLRPQPGELPDGSYVREVVTRGDCGIVLDLHNIWVNEQNGRQSVADFLASIPLDRVWEIHVAGGERHHGYWLDAHSGLVPGAVMRLAAEVVPALPNLRALIFEILPPYVPRVGIDAVRKQLESLQDIWALRRGTAPAWSSSTTRPTSPSRSKRATTSPQQWERSLTTLVTGGTDSSALTQTLALDPGVAILRELVLDARAGNVSDTARLTCRLLLAQGEDCFSSTFNAYVAAVPPQKFAAAEAVNFLEFVLAQSLPIAHLREVAGFERAVIQSATSQDQRTVRFDVNPLALLEALSQRRSPPDSLPHGPYEVSLDAGKVAEFRLVAAGKANPAW